VPTSAASVPGRAGGLNTSPCRSFHPVSSCASSSASSSLYREMSRFRVRTMIIATIPERKSMTSAELATLNQ
jgi:hypothetical protein